MTNHLQTAIVDTPPVSAQLKILPHHKQETSEQRQPTLKYHRWIQPLQQFVGGLLLLVSLPMILLLILVVKLTSRGPGLYSQRRVGLNGKVFLIHKIRTMRVDAEANTGPTWATQKDPRVTTIGRLLRALHLDEFPQLVNVVRGEMALIGPRPERPEFTQRLALEVTNYLDRLAVRPGITGLAQINLPPDTDLDSVRRKVDLDLQYIREASLFLDFRILVATFIRLLGARGTKPAEWLGLKREAHLVHAVKASGPHLVVVPNEDELQQPLVSPMTADDDGPRLKHGKFRLQRILPR